MPCCVQRHQAGHGGLRVFILKKMARAQSQQEEQEETEASGSGNLMGIQIWMLRKWPEILEKQDHFGPRDPEESSKLSLVTRPVVFACLNHSRQKIVIDSKHCPSQLRLICSRITASNCQVELWFHVASSGTPPWSRLIFASWGLSTCGISCKDNEFWCLWCWITTSSYL